MKTLEELLSQLAALGVKVAVDGEHLRVRAPRGTLTPELQAELAQRKPDIIALLGQAGAPSGSDSLAIRPVARHGPIAVSAAQRRLWFLDQLEPNSSTYNLVEAYRLVGPLDVSVLEQAVNEVVRRHEILRTTFASVDGEPVQIIAPSLRVSLAITDVQSTPAAVREATASRLIAEEAQCPFHLAQGPLLRALLLRLEAERHVLVLTVHHIVTDGWSSVVLARELAELYTAFSQGKPPTLPDLPVQYADYAAWQREWLESGVLAAQLQYWKRQLDAAPVLDLPSDYPRPPSMGHRGAQEFTSLSSELTKALETLSRREGVTPFMTLLATFNLLLARYTGQTDIVVGSPIAGRTRPETAGLIGFFLNSLVLRTDLSGDPTFLELLARVREVCLGAYAHQDIPFERLLEELRVPRDLNRAPLFDVFLNLMPWEQHDFVLPGITVERLPLLEVESKFDWTIYVWDRAGCWELACVYRTDLFSPARMREMLRQYEYLLSQVLHDPGKRLSELTLVAPDSQVVLPDPRQPLSAEWLGAIHARVAMHADHQPERVAVADSHESWTYHELDRHSNQLANYLIANGILPGDVVVIYGHRSASLVWAVLGILKAGAVLFILDPAFPPARLVEYLRLARPRGWIYLEAAGALPQALDDYLAASSGLSRLTLPARPGAAERGLLAGYSDHDPQVAIGPDDPACVVFTSGSTGTPKGIVGRHGSLTHFEPWRQELCGLTADDRVAMLAGLAYSPLQRDIFTPLWVGATLFIPGEDTVTTPGQLAAWMAEHKITFAGLTPALGQMLTETAAGELCLPALRHVFFVGESLSRRDVAHLRRRAPNAICINTYGATETQRADSYVVLPPEQEGDQVKAAYPLGQGMPDVQLLVLTEERKLAGMGELGEIYVRSPHLALGYLGDEALTRARFVTNPFTNAEGDRLYRTGDLGRFLPDGNVEYAGRADRQVKIRGFRIELGEIEAVFEQHPQVRQAVAVVRDDLPGGRGLVAYLVASEEARPTIKALRTYMRERLPDYMTPVAFVFLNAVPLTPNGKVDLPALPKPGDQDRAEQEAVIAPRDEVERQLVQIWEEILGVHPVGIGDDFFGLGGHSLLGIRLLARIEKELGKKLPVAMLFQSPTVGRFAQAIRGDLASPGWDALVPIQDKGSRLPIFCVPPMADGSVLLYRRLAEYLSPQQPVYGLQPKVVGETETPLFKIEDIADYFVEQIRLAFPQSPYLILGYSFGGVIAYEMARTLSNQHQEVGLLAILDTNAYIAPRNTKALPWNLVIQRFVGHLGLRLRTHADNLAALPWRDRPGYVAERIRRIVREIRRDPVPHSEPTVHEALRFALNRYVPETYPGRVTLLRATKSEARSDLEATLGWSALATGGVDIVNVPGDHWSMIKEPHVRVLAETLQACIDQVTASNGQSTHGLRSD